MTVAELNALPAPAAAEALARCCGAAAWVERMVARRPYVSLNHLLGIAHAFWMGLGPEDWREAFSHHPRIGDRESLERRFASTADLASREQSAVAAASKGVLEALAEGNRAYEERFGYILIVFASGRSADEMLAALKDEHGQVRLPGFYDDVVPLTDRERQVMQLIAEGKTTKEVAVILGVAVKTAESHRSSLMSKLDIAPRWSSLVNCRVVFVARSSSQKSCEGAKPCM